MRRSIIPKNASPKMKYRILNRRNNGIKKVGRQTMNYNAKVKQLETMPIHKKVDFQTFLKNPEGYLEPVKDHARPGWGIVKDERKWNGELINIPKPLGFNLPSEIDY